MKTINAAVVLVLVLLLGGLILEVHSLREMLVGAAAAKPVTASRERVPGPALNDAALEDLRRTLREDFAEALEAQQVAFAEQLAAERENSVTLQQAALDEYFRSEALESRLWEILHTFILDVFHPANRKVFEEEMRAQQEAYEQEEIRRHPQKAVTNNLRQIASAGMQYILENGVSSVTYSQLEGEYFAPIRSVGGERYDTITVSENGGTITATMEDGTVVEFRY